MLKSRLVTKTTRQAVCPLLLSEAISYLSDDQVYAMADQVIFDVTECGFDKVEGLAMFAVLERVSNFRTTQYHLERIGFDPELIVND